MRAEPVGGVVGLRLRTACLQSLKARLEFARTLEAPEREIEANLRILEASPIFLLLKKAGVVAPATGIPRLAVRRFIGYQLRGTAEGIGAALNGRSHEIAIMSRLGQSLFEDVFLCDEPLSDNERAVRCGITCAEARQLRELVDRIYIESEVSDTGISAARQSSPEAVARFSVASGAPQLEFFNGKIWRGRYVVDLQRRDALLRTLTTAEACQARSFLFELELLERRNSLLHRLLDVVMEVQRIYLVSKDPDDRRPLTQAEVAGRLHVAPSVINRLISNKAVELPWGLEAPIKALFPSRKTILRDQVYILAVARPALTDNEIRVEVGRLFGVSLSRTSIGQYRNELRAPRGTTCGRRGEATAR